MNANQPGSFRFATAAQWAVCRFVQADVAAARAGLGLQPIAPYARPGKSYPSSGAHAPYATRHGELFWFDDRDTCYRLTTADDSPEAFPSPFAVRGQRVVATSRTLWLASGHSLAGYETDSLTRRATLEFAEGVAVDLADAGKDSLFVLLKRAAGWQALRVDAAGRRLEAVTFQGLAEPSAFVFLRRTRRFVVLDRGRLCWFSEQAGRALVSVTAAAVRPCFQGTVLGSDGRDRVFLAGSDGEDFGGNPYLLGFDADGNSIAELPLDPRDAPSTGVVATSSAVFVTGARGLSRFGLAEVVPAGVRSVQCEVTTPLLHSPDGPDQRRWLRIEATATLPEGATLQIAFAATADPALREHLNIALRDAKQATGALITPLLQDPDLYLRTTEFQGSAAAGRGPNKFSAKLFDVRQPYVWVWITLSAAPARDYRCSRS